MKTIIAAALIAIATAAQAQGYYPYRPNNGFTPYSTYPYSTAPTYDDTADRWLEQLRASRQQQYQQEQLDQLRELNAILRGRN
jgi:hypothetical protein